MGKITKKKIKVFFSHRDKYKKSVYELKKCIEKISNNTISCFVAHSDIEPARNFIEVIKEEIKNSDVMLLFMTNDFL